MPGQGGQEAVDRLHRDGHVVRRGALAASVVRRGLEAACVAFDEVVSEHPEALTRKPSDYVSVLGLRERDRALRDIVCAPELARFAAAALGVERVRLLYDELLVKLPGAFPTVWHQDQGYWPIDTSDVIEEGRISSVRAWVNLAPLPAEVGGLHFVDGSHRVGPVDVRGMHLGPPGQDDTATLGETDHAITDYGAFAPGDATLHAGYTVHGARANLSETTRYAVAIVYVPDGTRVAEPTDWTHEVAIGLHTPGRRPGDLVDTDANPVLWPPEAA